jgi:hypothetical protein
VQKPSLRATERDEAAIARWREHKWLAIKKTVRAEAPYVEAIVPCEQL